MISPREESPEALFAVLGYLRSPFRELKNASQFHKRHPGEVSMPLHVLAQRGNHVNVDVETDGFWELLQAEHIDMTALTWRESRCMFYSSPRKAHPKRLQRTRPVRQPRKGTDVLIWLSAAVGSCAYPRRLNISPLSGDVRSREH